uniref:Myosin motor domain-containing protein n=1 Tax=Timema tahoe TaxID=61484 RepID=A0A7R9IC26_9NEOP|nr:unnamed protein product [Timema tahoe]
MKIVRIQLLKKLRQNTQTTEEQENDDNETPKDDISKLFVSMKGPSISSTLGSSVVGMDGTQSLRRASSIRRTFTTGTAGIKRKSLSLQVKFTIDGLIETLRRTKLKFIHCFLPHHNAGLTDLHNSVLKNNSSTLNADDLLINLPLVRSQLRGAQILDAVRLHKQGFPKFLPLSEFRRRFLLLAPPDGRPTSPILDERKAVEEILHGMELDLTSYRVGMSQGFERYSSAPLNSSATLGRYRWGSVPKEALRWTLLLRVSSIIHGVPNAPPHKPCPGRTSIQP